MLKLTLVARPWLAALPCHAGPRIPGDDCDVLERLPLRARGDSHGARRLSGRGVEGGTDFRRQALI